MNIIDKPLARLIKKKIRKRNYKYLKWNKHYHYKVFRH